MLEEESHGEEQGEESAVAQAIVENQAPTRRGWLNALMAVALVAVVAMFVGLEMGRVMEEPPIHASTTAPVSWQTYRDPLELYSIRIPRNWTASVTTGSFTMGSRSGSFSGKSEDAMFSDPALGQASARIWIHADQINSAFGREWYCTAYSPSSQKNSTFNGYPAEELQPGTVWLFESYNAHFQIDVEIPGVIAPINPGGPMIPNPPPPTPTPLPSAWVKADWAIIATALASFKPADKPLTCS